MLLNSSVGMVDGQRHRRPSESDELVINIEVSTEHLLQEKESDASESPGAKGEPYVTVKSISKRLTRQAALTQNIELEVSITTVLQLQLVGELTNQTITPPRN